jgi:electron transport protein HydN
MASHCIGCKTCMLVCPFGAMNMVEQTSHGSMVRAQAHKCDLCHSREAGPACIEVCPTKALKLVTPMALETLQRDRQLRAARGAAPGIVR